MKIQIYVPTRKAEHYNGEAPITFTALQHGIIDMTGGVTLHTAFGSWRNAAGAIVSEPVFILETLVVSEVDKERIPVAGEPIEDEALDQIADLFTNYAKQLIDSGEESVMVVVDGVPTFITEEDFQ